jgi:hypothetical protein
MNQLEFKFFWPLTEQIPLDLDYTNCDTRAKGKPYHIDVSSFAPNGITYSATGSVSVGPIILQTDDLRIRRSTKPRLITRILYKLFDIKWEQTK